MAAQPAYLEERPAPIRIDSAQVGLLARQALIRHFRLLTVWDRVIRLPEEEGGGEAVELRWTDGPTVAQVELLLGPLAGISPARQGLRQLWWIPELGRLLDGALPRPDVGRPCHLLEADYRGLWLERSLSERLLRPLLLELRAAYRQLDDTAPVLGASTIEELAVELAEETPGPRSRYDRPTAS